MFSPCDMVICKGIPAINQHGLFYHIASFIANREYMCSYAVNKWNG